MERSLRSSVIADYDELLRAKHWQSTVEHLSAAAHEIGLNLLAPERLVLRPFFLDSDRYRALLESARLVTRALAVMSDRALVDPGLRRRLMLTDEEEVYVAAELDPREPYGRLDGVLQGDSDVKFLEYNSVPGTAPLTELLSRVVDELPIMAEMRRRYRLRFPPTGSRIIPACLRAFQLRGGKGLPNVAVAMGAHGGLSGFDAQDASYTMQAAVAAGIPLLPVSPESLELRDGRLCAGDFVVDCVTYLDLQDFQQGFPPTHPLWQAARAGSLIILGSPALLATRGNKATFALLSDPELAATLPPEVRDAVARHVPWTRVVRDERTTHAGETVELLPYLSRERERFVLKPSTDRGGFGVTLGWACDATTWDALLQQATKGEQTFVAQERVPTNRESYPHLVDGELRFADFDQDCNTFTWNDETDGCLVRVAPGGLLNLHAGGTMAPLFIIDPD
jgi:hypothetical protein